MDLFKRNRKKKKSAIEDWTESLIVAIVLAAIVKAFLIQTYMVPTGSMEKTILVGDFLFGNRLSYGIKVPFKNKFIVQWKKPERGQIVIFKYPYANKLFVKRCVGLGGDTIQVINKILYVNHKKMIEPYVQHIDPVTYPPLDIDSSLIQQYWENKEFLYTGLSVRDNFGPVVVPKGCYFMMGDNRDNSDDSRFWGPLKNKYVVGTPLFIYFSWDNKAPLYQIWRKIRFSRIFRFPK